MKKVKSSSNQKTLRVAKNAVTAKNRSVAVANTPARRRVSGGNTMAVSLERNDDVKTRKRLRRLVDRDPIDHDPGMPAQWINHRLSCGNTNHQSGMRAERREVAMHK
jgi:hypothetical protein